MPYPSRRKPASGDGPVSKRPKQSAKSYTMWLLSQRDYSAATLRKKLLSKEYTAEEADEALAFMQENRFQDDERFARVKAENKASKMGDRGIRFALSDKGVSQEIISKQIEQLDPESERVLLACRKFEGKEMSQGTKQKVFRFLASRGFSASAIKAGVAHLVALQPEKTGDEMDDFPEDFDE